MGKKRFGTVENSTTAVVFLEDIINLMDRAPFLQRRAHEAEASSPVTGMCKKSVQIPTTRKGTQECLSPVGLALHVDWDHC